MAYKVILLDEVWSRHINKKDRIIYDINDDIEMVTIFSCEGHYDDH